MLASWHNGLIDGISGDRADRGRCGRDWLDKIHFNDPKGRLSGRDRSFFRVCDRCADKAQTVGPVDGSGPAGKSLSAGRQDIANIQIDRRTAETAGKF